MKKEDKAKVIEQLKELLETYPHAYLVDAMALDAEQTTALRRQCFQHGVKMMVVKNSLLHRAFVDINEEQYEPFHPYLKGTSALMLSETANAPARVLKDFHKELKSAGADIERPSLKAAYVYETFYLGAAELDTLAQEQGGAPRRYHLHARVSDHGRHLSGQLCRQHHPRCPGDSREARRGVRRPGLSRPPLRLRLSPSVTIFAGT